MASNAAQGNGGAIHVQTSNLNNEMNATVESLMNQNQLHVSNTDFTTSKVGTAGTGGHVSLSHTNASFINGCTFGATTSEDGGALHVSTTKLVLSTATSIAHTTAQQHGGAIYASKQSDVLLNGVTIVGTSASVDGGALYVEENSRVNVTQSRMHQTTAGRNGGAVRVSSGSIALLSHTEVLSSSAGENGGGVYVSTAADSSLYDLSALTMAHVTTTHARALAKGGNVFVKNGHMHMMDCNDVNSYSSHGGALRVEGRMGVHVVLRTTVKDSHATNGGFLSTFNTVVDLKHVEVVNATAFAFGGAMHLQQSDVTHDGCTFTHASSRKSGGGVWMESSTVQHPTQSGSSKQIPQRSSFLHADAPTGSFATVRDNGRSDGTNNVLSHIDVRHSTSAQASVASTSTSDGGSAATGSTLHVHAQSSLLASYLTINATESGVAVHAGSFAVLDMEHTTLTNTNSGSGLLASENAVVRVSFSTIQFNNYSGIVAQTNSHVNVTSTQLNDNMPTEYGGGAMFTLGATVFVRLSTFTRNIGANKAGGSVMCSDKSACTFEICTFSNPVSAFSKITKAAASHTFDSVLTLASKGGAITVRTNEWSSQYIGPYCTTCTHYW